MVSHFLMSNLQEVTLTGRYSSRSFFDVFVDLHIINAEFIGCKAQYGSEDSTGGGAIGAYIKDSENKLLCENSFFYDCVCLSEKGGGAISYNGKSFEMTTTSFSNCVARDGKHAFTAEAKSEVSYCGVFQCPIKATPGKKLGV